MTIIDEVDKQRKLEQRIENLEMAVMKIGRILATEEQPALGQLLHDTCRELYDKSSEAGGYKKVVFAYGSELPGSKGGTEDDHS